MSKLIRVSDKNHKQLHNMVGALDFADVDKLITEMIKSYQEKLKKSG